MRSLDAADVERLLAYPDLIDVLDQAFQVGAISPLRHHHQIAFDGRPEATLLLMPAWTASAPDAATAGDYAGVKLATVVPDNGPRLGLPAISGVYLLISTDTGQPLALVDGPRLTVWRTAGASGLASRYLSRPDSERLLVVGAGALAPYLIRAHASVRPIKEVMIWNRTPSNADRVRDALPAGSPPVTVYDSLEAAVRNADIVSTATISETPLIHGDWLQPGTHVDCVGAFRPTMRETDDEVIRRARLWVDTRVGGLSEAGDVVIPLNSGVISEDKIEGDLYELARGECAVRFSDDDITMFKSVGASIEDLAAAVALYERAEKGN